MNLNPMRSLSLKVRVSVFTFVIFFVCICSLGLYARGVLRDSMQTLLGEQQFVTVSYIAEAVNRELEQRQSALTDVVQAVTPAHLQQPATLQALLEQRPVLHTLFNGGVVALRPDGTVIADVPLATGRLGANFLASADVAAALREGKSTVGRPLMGFKLHAPIFGMTVPIRDRQGVVIGALCGITNLGAPNFLDIISHGRYGNEGGYLLLVAPQHRLIVTSSDKRRIMQSVPEPGKIPQVDRFIQGFEGSAIYTNPLGVEVLASGKGVAAAGWRVTLTLPTAQVFAPIRAVELRLLWASLALTVLAGLVTWRMIKRQLSPMVTAARTLAAWSESAAPVHALPIARQDEVGRLIGAFNRLLGALEKRNVALGESEFRWKFAIEGSGVGVWDWNIQTGSTQYSALWKEMLGFGDGDSLSADQQWVHLIHPQDRPRVLQANQAYLDGVAPRYVVEFRMGCKDGSYKWVLSRGVVVAHGPAGEPLRMIGTHMDITQRKLKDAALRDSRQRLRELAAQNEANLEHERKHIAREVHDELGQTLTALRMGLLLIEMRFCVLDPELNLVIADQKQLVDRAMLGVRNVATNLRPAAMDMGLIAAIEWLSRDFTQRSATPCQLLIQEQGIELDEGRSMLLFRIVQESLTNISRYAQASQVDIAMGRGASEMWVEVRDNGCGFDLATVAPQRTFGLLGMRERALAMGGHVDIASAPGQGTVISVMIPIAAAKDDS